MTMTASVAMPAVVANRIEVELAGGYHALHKVAEGFLACIDIAQIVLRLCHLTDYIIKKRT